MKIPSPTITSNRFNCALKVQDKLRGLPPLSVGEVAEAEILENSRSGNAPILLKNKRNRVYCKLPLRKGEKITVRVIQLHPKLILRIVPDEIPRNSKLMDHLDFVRSNPKMLSTLLIEADAIFNSDNLGKLEVFIGKDDIRHIQDMVKSLIFSRESVKNPLFFREFVHKFGYLFERESGWSLKNRPWRALSAKNSGQNLKALLLKISDGFQVQAAGENFPAQEKLSAFVRSALTTIEAHQGLNYLLQEQEGKYMFQIPLLFPENIGLAEIFVKFNEQESTGRRRRGKQSVLICLDMDALGRIVVETVIEKKKMGCTLKCKDRNVADFIIPFLAKLGQKLEDLGYKLDHLKCRVEENGLQSKREFYELQTLFASDRVDFLV